MILILDEPTNFLDENHIAWLTEFLKNYENAFILVSHDIPFMNSVINVVYHVENAVMTRYTGDYDNFVRMYELKKRQIEQAYEKQQKEIADLEDFIARNKARVATTNMAKSRQKKLDKMDKITLAREKPKPTFSFRKARTPGRVVIDCKDIVLGYDTPLTKPVSVQVENGQKIAIRGVNGIGKSTLLNTLTDADVLEEDQLFATLDPTTRMLELSNHQNLMLTDTVGFIRKLPHHLVDAFKSTLEEAKYADFIIHVVDASNPQWDAQMHVVYMTLQDLGVVDKKILTVFNKCDRITGEEILQDFRADKTLRISAKTGMGLDTLKEVFEDMLRDGKVLLKHTFPYEKAGEIQKIRKYGELLKEEYTPEGIYVEAYVPPEL